MLASSMWRRRASVADDEVFKLQAHDRVPLWERFERTRAVEALLDALFLRLDVAEVKAAVVVTEAILRGALLRAAER